MRRDTTINQEHAMSPIPEDIRRAERARYEAIERANDAILAAHPENSRYCYTCQVWLSGAAEAEQHPGHSIH